MTGVHINSRDEQGKIQPVPEDTRRAIEEAAEILRASSSPAGENNKPETATDTTLQVLRWAQLEADAGRGDPDVVAAAIANYAALRQRAETAEAQANDADVKSDAHDDVFAQALHSRIGHIEGTLAVPIYRVWAEADCLMGELDEEWLMVEIRSAINAARQSDALGRGSV